MTLLNLVVGLLCSAMIGLNVAGVLCIFRRP